MLTTYRYWVMGGRHPEDNHLLGAYACQASAEARALAHVRDGGAWAQVIDLATKRAEEYGPDRGDPATVC